MEPETVDEHLEVQESEVDNELTALKGQSKSYSRKMKQAAIQCYECQNKYKTANKSGTLNLNAS